MEIRLTRTIGPVGLLFTGLGSIIGSGWLFGAWHASMLAGPAAIFSWIIGAVIAMAIALTYAELGTAFPESGGMARYARYSHGSLVGFIAAWATWVSTICVIPIEAIASVQYMASWSYPWAHALMSNGELSGHGLALSSVLVVGYFALNYWGVALFVKTNSIITIFKFVVPGMTSACLMWNGFHPENFALDSAEHFAPYGWSAALTAVAASGIVFSFNGFQNPVNLAGEVKNPSWSIPFALIGSIVLALIIYLALQVAFIGAVDPSDIAKGWHQLNFSSPLAELAIALNLNWLAIVLYADAFVSPSGSATVNVATTARMVYAMERNGTMPRIFGTLHPVYGVPRAAMWFNIVIAFGFLFFFRGWGQLAAVISVAVSIAFLTGPSSVMALRKHAPDVPRPLKLRAMGIIAPFAFVCASLVLYWSCWPLTGQIVLLMAAGLPIYIFFQSKSGWSGFKDELRSALWMVLYLPFMAMLSMIGGKNFGGMGLIADGVDLVIVVVAALVFYVWAINSGRRTVYLQERTTANVAEAAEGAGFMDTQLEK